MIKINLKGDLQKEYETALKIQKNKVIQKSLVALKEATPVLTGKAQTGWEQVGDSIVNHVDYIDDLNAGSSQKAPEYFIERTLLAQEGLHPSGTIVRSI